METKSSTTYYPAILLRKRWREASPNERAGFDVGRELRHIQGQARLISNDITRLEQWSAGAAD